jgi:hypothetical protein
MNCADCRELLVGYIEGLLDAHQNEEICRHLKTCIDCRKELEEAKALQNRLVVNGHRSNANDIENAVMDRIIREQAFKLRKANQDKQHVNIWRLIMRNRIVQLAAAAAIIIAILVGIYFITGKTPAVTCCAWAKIADKVQQFKTCVCRIHIQQSGGAVGQKGQQIESKMYISSDYGYRTETSLDGNVMQQMYMNPGEKAMIIVMPSDKKYMRMVLTDDYLPKMKSQMQDPRYALTRFMTGQFKELGKDVIGGVEVKGIEVVNPPAVSGIYNNFIGRTWVDVATEYPVRIEIDTEIGTGADKMKMLMVMDDFEWGAELDPGIFEPNIPADYTMMSEMKMPGHDEASAIEGLRLFAEMTDGNYPSQMNVMTLTKESAEAYGKKLGATKTKPTDEQTQQMTATMVKFQSPVLFYIKLTQDGNDPAYYGKDVTPGDANAVLMSWKISDDTYRVIFGDLSVENVTAEQLRKMEQAVKQ